MVHDERDGEWLALVMRRLFVCVVCPAMVMKIIVASVITDDVDTIAGELTDLLGVFHRVPSETNSRIAADHHEPSAQPCDPRRGARGEPRHRRCCGEYMV